MPLDVAKRGTLDIKDPPLKAIVAANDNYDKGYHEGNVGGLDAVDADLATANIKSGITVFGKAGAVTVQDIADADLTVAEAPTGKKFYAVTGGVKTGTGTKTLDPDNDTVAAGYYAATTLSTVDADLAAANIKSGVEIFGKVGTLAAGTATHDIEAGAVATGTASDGTEAVYYTSLNVNASSDSVDLATLTQTYAAGSLAEAYGFILIVAWGGTQQKVRLYMDGTQVGETGYLPASPTYVLMTVNGNKALSGSKIVKIVVHNDEGVSRTFHVCGRSTGAGVAFTAGVFAGSVKVV